MKIDIQIYLDIYMHIFMYIWNVGCRGYEEAEDESIFCEERSVAAAPGRGLGV